MTGSISVVDANVFVSIFAAEPDGDRWLSKLEGRHWIAPKLARFECAVVFARKARLGSMSRPQAAAALAALDAASIAWTPSDDPAVDRAFALSLGVGHELADCVYLAMALAAKAPLATADAKLAAVAARQGVEVLALSAA